MTASAVLHLRSALATRLGALLATLALTTACATESTSARAAGPREDVKALIGDAACSSDAQCHTIGVGSKACGGPAAYLAFSSLRTDEAALRAAAEKQATAQRHAQAAEGRVSTCSITPDPGAFCDMTGASGASSTGAAGVCRLREARGAGGLPTR